VLVINPNMGVRKILALLGVGFFSLLVFERHLILLNLGFSLFACVDVHFRCLFSACAGWLLF